MIRPYGYQTRFLVDPNTPSTDSHVLVKKSDSRVKQSEGEREFEVLTAQLLPCLSFLAPDSQLLVGGDESSKQAHLHHHRS